jgi:transcriptional regulator with XRE-family HTH domain
VKTLKEILAQRVKSLRNFNGWTQAELAERARVPQPVISRIETKQNIPSSDTLLKIAGALGTTTSYLLGELEDSAA